ncbi:MAG: vanadium-dependent haloperoxidase [Chitinophagales bacterium]|nr:vanadium-dependent haloperoxidase [Chitinophagales bacterium]
MKILWSASLFLIGVTLVILTGCKKEGDVIAPSSTVTESKMAQGSHTDKYPADVAISWMNMQLQIMKTATGIANVAFCRPYAYSGITLYQSVLPGMPFYKSFVGQLTNMPAMPEAISSLKYYWPSSANAAMASILKKMYPATSAQNITSIDSLENVLSIEYSAAEDTATINRSIAFGRSVAQAVFDWSETDGYLHAADPYTPPVGPGLWVPTAPSFAPASEPYWGNLRVMVSGSGDNAQPGAPIPYSEDPNSAFYNMVKQVYDVSQTLTAAQTDQALYWRDVGPGVTTPGHYLSILEQLFVTEKPALDKAAAAYALCSISVFDAAISCWQTKYNFNLVRPITYITTVLGHTTWLPLLTTPAHPEYSSAHAVLSVANAVVLTQIFGDNYSFTDHTYDYLGYAPRAFTSFRALAEDAANSRLYAGIHYQPSIDVGITQGKTIANNIIHTLRFKK